MYDFRFGPDYLFEFLRQCLKYLQESQKRNFQIPQGSRLRFVYLNINNLFFKLFVYNMTASKQEC